jgi:aminomethyltransferase
VSVGTAFFDRERQRNAKLSWGEWSGYHAAAVYADAVDIEYNAVREAAAVFDVSPLFKYEVDGHDAATLLDRVVTRDVSRLALDQVLYTPWCDEDGKVIDDGTVTRLAPDRFRVTAADPSYRWFALNAGGLDVTIRDVSESTAALALQGRLSRHVLERATRAEWFDLGYFRRRPATIAGVEVDVTRTGYTGDLGYEIWVEREKAEALWDAIMEKGKAHDLAPAGMLALDTARIEAGLILAEVEYVPARKAVIDAQRYSPFELSLDWAVALEKGPFTGRKALREERDRGPARRTVGLVIDWRSIEGRYSALGLPPQPPARPWRSKVPLYVGHRQVGWATSGAWSPLLKKYIAIATVSAAYARPGTRMEIDIAVEWERHRIPATVVARPFFEPERKKA